MSVCDQYVHLRGGLSVPAAPVLLLLDLEAKGFKVTRDGDDIIVCPASQLSDDDKRQIKLWKRHCLVLLDYTPPEVQ